MLRRAGWFRRRASSSIVTAQTGSPHQTSGTPCSNQPSGDLREPSPALQLHARDRRAHARRLPAVGLWRHLQQGPARTAAPRQRPGRGRRRQGRARPAPVRRYAARRCGPRHAGRAGHAASRRRRRQVAGAGAGHQGRGGRQARVRLAPRSLPPPRTGKVQQGVFPPAPGAPGSLSPPVPKTADAGKALTVLRYQPEGDVSLVPQLTVTFSQPMLAVTSQDDAAKIQPVKLTPQPARPLALARHQDHRLRSRGPVPAGHHLPGRDPRRHDQRDRQQARQGGHLLVRDARRPRRVRVAQGDSRSAATCRCSSRSSTRRSIRPRCWPSGVTAGGGASPCAAADRAGSPRTSQLQRADRQAKVTRPADRYVAFKASQPSPGGQRRLGPDRPGTPSLEGPNVTPEAQSFDVPHLPAAGASKRPSAAGTTTAAPAAVRFRVQQRARQREVRRRHGHGHARRAGPAERWPRAARSCCVGATAANTTYKVTIPQRHPGRVRPDAGCRAGVHVDASVRQCQASTRRAACSSPTRRPRRRALDVFTIGLPERQGDAALGRARRPAGVLRRSSRMWDKDNPPKLPGKQAFNDK
jgi:hypothetical protein